MEVVLFNFLFSLCLICSAITSNFLNAEVAYEVHDLGTLQTRQSAAIDLNNNGQVLGWYVLDNIQPSGNGKVYFLREKNGDFHIIPSIVDVEVEWRFLTLDGKVYGTKKLYDNNSNTALFMWDKENGAIKLGDLPGRDVAGVNNQGQALIRCVSENCGEATFNFPVVWQVGKVTQLKGLQGNLGTESELSGGVAINNNGDVIGNSQVITVYKNSQYLRSVHAVLWKDGEVKDLNSYFGKNQESTALAINDEGEMLISGTLGGLYIDKCGNSFSTGSTFRKMNNIGWIYEDKAVFDTRLKKRVATISEIDNQVKSDADSIWWNIFPHIKKVNDLGEIITDGKTIYGENHAVILKPKKCP